MIELQRKMHQLLNQVQRKLLLEDQIQLWNAQIESLMPQVQHLQVIMTQEQNDVEKLEHVGLASMMHTILGTMDEKIAKEQQEADEAAENYSAACDKLTNLQAQVHDAECELLTLKTCREEYLDILKAQVELMEQTALHMTEQPQQVGKRLSLERQRRSLREALLYCDYLIHATGRITFSLDRIPGLSEAATIEGLSKAASAEAESAMELATILQAKLAQMGIDPQDHLLVGPYFRTPNTYFFSTDETWSRLQEAAEQVEILNKDARKVHSNLTEALTLVENAIENFE